MQFIDTNSLDQVRLWDAFTLHDSVDGIIYLDYSAYDKERGRIVWSNGKPIVSAAAKL